MAVTHAPAGFTGTVDQIDEARRFAMGGGRIKVSGSTDWTPTANSGATRTVNIAAGMASACGVVDITTAADSLTFAANAGGSDRFDAVVATWDWSNATISFRVIQGTTVPPALVRTGTTVDATKINWLPGTRYDAVIAIIRARPGVTTLAPADLYDCRPWGSWSRLNVTTSAYKDQIDVDPGGRIRDSAGVIWEWDGTVWVAVNAMGKMWRTFGFSGNLTGSVTYPVGLNVARVVGGVTHDAATFKLTLPFDGMWSIVGRGYATGGPPPYDMSFSAVRSRAAVADLGLCAASVSKDTGQDRMPHFLDTVPLKAADTIWMTVTSAATGGNYWGVNEAQGVMLSVQYVGPLNGATPL